MKATVIAAVIFAVSLVTTASTQTERQLDEKYQKVTAYQVRPNIWLTAQFDKDGHMCQLALQPRYALADRVELYSALSDEDAKAIAEEVIPDAERGARMPGLENSVVVISGPSMTTSYQYEKITVSVYRDFRHKRANALAAVVSWRDRPCTKE
jgi:hypothetical protein